MGTEVLRSQNCWVERFPVLHGATKGNRLGYTKSNHINNSNNSKKRNPNQKTPSYPNEVTIVRRGDSLDSLNCRIKKDRSKKKTSFDPADLYAGSAFSTSPPPSSLPLPSFFKKQEFNSFDDSATRDLRRLLRLE